MKKKTKLIIIIIKKKKKLITYSWTCTFSQFKRVFQLFNSINLIGHFIFISKEILKGKDMVTSTSYYGFDNNCDCEAELDSAVEFNKGFKELGPLTVIIHGSSKSLWSLKHIKLYCIKNVIVKKNYRRDKSAYYNFLSIEEDYFLELKIILSLGVAQNWVPSKMVCQQMYSVYWLYLSIDRRHQNQLI
ncbi:hypothetical protein AGLY_009334 [Aphis glycines]|uniref:Uncharacterized protein n=1 Tax=Aphis glycines TaxID=307491 RepID=A0A6G0TK99_APHGL|nr:hypothetical protein AGLY_009334 [Aphis glycines]